MNKLLLQKYFKYVSLYLASSRSPDEAFELALAKVKDKKFGKAFGVFVESVKSGKDIDACVRALLAARAIDGTLYSLIILGYKTGALQEHVQYGYQYLDKNLLFKKKIAGALAYPAVVLSASFLSVIYISYAVMPKVVPVFASLKAPLPLSTRFLLSASEYVAEYGFACALGISACSVGLFLIYGRHPGFRDFVQRNQYRAPLLGSLFSLSDVQRISLSVGTLLRAQVPVTDALTITSDACHNAHLENGLNFIRRHFEEGKSLSELKVESRVINQDFCDALVLGESTGSMPQALLDLSELSRQEYEDQLKKISSMTEPLALVVSAVLVSAVALSVISPMYSLVQHVN